MKRIGITIGDPAGIGPEIIAAALSSDQLPPDCEFQVIGTTPDSTTPGTPTTTTARAALDALEQAVRLARDGRIDAVVTAPVSKSNLQSIGFPFPGQTEFLADRFATTDYAMCLTGGGLTVGLVTIHIPLRDVAHALRSEEIVRVGSLLARFMQARGIASPRIAVPGLNPHAGENGTIGTEDMEIILPAIATLSKRWDNKATFDGPLSPDTVFHWALDGRWDAVLCMYHDQGLIPLKMHAFHSGVNTTLGLPIIRTSPDHGTAYELAGTGSARPDSMLAAIRLAAELVAKQ